MMATNRRPSISGTNRPEEVTRESLAKIRPGNPAEMDKLLDAATYQKKIQAGEIH
jgi:hypothetical protein